MRLTSIVWIRAFLLLALSFNLVSWSGCSNRPSSELTKEQLEKQQAADAESIADEDRLEAELKKKAKKR
jgi:hypothetical protein